MRWRNLTLLLAALLPAPALVRALVRLLTRGGHAGPLVTRAWAWSFRLPIPYGLRLRTLRLLGYSFIVGAVAVIRSPDGRCLLARHTYPVGRFRREVWGLPGGAVEKYERIPQALRRELAQELGLEIAVERLLLVDTSEAPLLDFVFACNIRDGRFRPSSEVAEIGWFELSHPPDGTSDRHRRVLELVAAERLGALFT
jgi:8-oxo-dGTP diphosphatase